MRKPVQFEGDSLKRLRDFPSDAVDALGQWRRGMSNENRFDSVWDALADTPEEAANMKLRSELMIEIRNIVEASEESRRNLAARAGITAPRLSDLMGGRIRKFSLDALVNISTALGAKVTIEIEPSSATAAPAAMAG